MDLSPSKADLRVRWVIACSRRATAIRQGDLEAALVESRRIDLLLDQWPASDARALSRPA